MRRRSGASGRARYDEMAGGRAVFCRTRVHVERNNERLAETHSPDVLEESTGMKKVMLVFGTRTGGYQDVPAGQ